ncbi:hypothetical protein BASA83_002909 [Batrachochytrium salamandrivorans]|nr:hypothetical protein BASA83_002909 [Batrachochytrium salamandrivorans]
MDAELADRLNIPLVKIPIPIKLRLADGDSSSMITHRTLPLQLHIGRHVETIGFYVTSLCHGIILGRWLKLIQRSQYGSRSGCQKPVLRVSKALRNRSHLLKTIQTEVYPFLEASPVSETPIPLDINKEFSSVFSESQANILPAHRSFDCAINLSSSAEPSYGRIYQLTREEDKVMQEWISENLAKGFIRNSSSPYGAPCFFVKQKDKLRLCMDYRGLNKQTVKDRNPIPLISEMLRTLSTGKIFTTLDLRGAYNLLRIKEGDEPKTAFITKYGQFEFLVMPFGLANAPAQFQRMMNSLFRHMISKFVLVYLDDIVVYSDNLEDHKKHVRQVLQILKDNNLFCKAEKCHFYQTEIKYLGYIISPNGTSMDPSKISAVQDWPAPKKVRELQVFLGFTNFYRALVSGYSDITCHLTKLLKKDVPFSWGPEQEASFKKLKDAFARPGFLAHPNDEQPFILETDASDFAISGVLHQHDQTNTLRPVAFYARQMNNAERNYDIYDKELLAMVESFKHWRHLLQGKLNGRANSLSRREDYFLDSDQSNFQRVIDPDNVLDLQVAMADLDLHVLVHSTVLDKVFVQEADWPLIIADFLAGEDNVWIEEISEDWLELCKKELKNFRFRDNTFVRILNDGKSTATYMPSNDRVQVMKHYHESLAHLKYGSIIDLITRRFWWPDMKKDLKDYISRYPECQLNRSASRTYAPLPIRPVPPVALPFERWGIDFYGPMMETKSGSKYLITCIDYATRWVLAKPVREMTEAAVATFLYDLMMNYGAPFEIISDRGKSFLAEGISEFERENSIRHLATTPYHPQTNGMVERMHAMLGHGLTTLVADKRDRWDEYLPQVLLAIRTRTHAVTGFSPFYLLFGTHPRLPNDETPPRSSLMPLDEIEKMEENSEFIARNLEEVGQARSAANFRTKA